MAMLVYRCVSGILLSFGDGIDPGTSNAKVFFARGEFLGHLSYLDNLQEGILHWPQHPYGSMYGYLLYVSTFGHTLILWVTSSRSFGYKS